MTIKNFSLASFYTPWSGAVDTWEKIIDADKVDDLEAYFEELYPDGIESVTAINDELWFSSDEILEYLGLADEDDEEEEDEE